MDNIIHIKIFGFYLYMQPIYQPNPKTIQKNSRTFYNQKIFMSFCGISDI